MNRIDQPMVSSPTKPKPLRGIMLQNHCTVGLIVTVLTTDINVHVCTYCFCRKFLSRVSTLTHDNDIAILSVCARDVPPHIVTVCSPYGSPVILVLPASNIFTKF